MKDMGASWGYSEFSSHMMVMRVKQCNLLTYQSSPFWYVVWLPVSNGWFMTVFLPPWLATWLLQVRPCHPALLCSSAIVDTSSTNLANLGNKIAEMLMVFIIITVLVVMVMVMLVMVRVMIMWCRGEDGHIGQVVMQRGSETVLMIPRLQISSHRAKTHGLLICFDNFKLSHLLSGFNHYVHIYIYIHMAFM